MLHMIVYLQTRNNLSGVWQEGKASAAASSKWCNSGSCEEEARQKVGSPPCKAGWPVQAPSWKNTMEYDAGEKRGPGGLALFQELPHPSLRMAPPNGQKIK